MKNKFHRNIQSLERKRKVTQGDLRFFYYETPNYKKPDP